MNSKLHTSTVNPAVAVKAVIAKATAAAVVMTVAVAAAKAVIVKKDQAVLTEPAAVREI